MSNPPAPRLPPVYMLARTAHTVTDGLLLRTFSPADAPPFRAYRADAGTARFQSWDPADYAGERGVAASAKFCAQHHLFGAHVFGRIDYTALRGRWLQLALEDGAGTLVGDVGVLVAPDGRQATLGVTLAPAARGRGYARAGLRMALDWLFAAVPVADPRALGKGKAKAEGDDGEKDKEGAEEEDVGAEDGVYVPGVAVHRASAMVDARNERSAHLLDSLGFRKEAHHVQSSFYKNEWCDDDVWATLRTEWIDRKYPPPQ